MRGVVALAVVAAVAYRSGRRQGDFEGQLKGIGKMAAAYSRGITDGRS